MFTLGDWIKGMWGLSVLSLWHLCESKIISKMKVLFFKAHVPRAACEALGDLFPPVHHIISSLPSILPCQPLFLTFPPQDLCTSSCPHVWAILARAMPQRGSVLFVKFWLQEAASQKPFLENVKPSWAPNLTFSVCPLMLTLLTCCTVFLFFNAIAWSLSSSTRS